MPFRIEADPPFRTVTPEQRMDFRLVAIGDEDVSEVHDVRWRCVNDDSTSGRASRPWYAGAQARGPNGWSWSGADWDFVGHHRVMVRFLYRGREQFVEFPVTVVAVNEMLGTRPAFSDHLEAPEVFLAGYLAQTAAIRTAESALPGPTATREAYEDRMEKRDETAAHLRELLNPSRRKPRYPVRAQYYSSHNTRPGPNGGAPWSDVRAFLTEWDDDCWALVDWTNALHTQTSGNYDGIMGYRYDTPSQAFGAWDSNNSYPTGLISYEYDMDARSRPTGAYPGGSSRAPVRARFSSHFETDGRSTLDEFTRVLDWIALAGAVVAGVVTALAPVPGSRVVSAVIWGAIFTSISTGVASSALRIGARAEDGHSNFRDDGLDVLTIAASLLGATAAVRTATSAGRAGANVIWREGAVVLTRQAAITRGIVIGAFTLDLVQGVIVSEAEIRGIRRIASDDTIHADERLSRMVRAVAGLLANGALLAYNFRTTRADIRNSSAQNTELPPEPTSGDRLRRLSDPDDTVDLDQLARGEGNTTHGRHRTRVETEPSEHLPPDLETTRRTGEVTTPRTDRESERPYRLPPEHHIVEPGSPLPVLDPRKTYLWAVDPDGRMIVAPERQPGFGRVVKHRDLLPNPDGSPGPGRAGGELNYNRDNGEWMMNNESSMTFARGDGTHSGNSELRASYELMEQAGTDMTSITYANTHGSDRPEGW